MSSSLLARSAAGYGQMAVMVVGKSRFDGCSGVRNLMGVPEFVPGVRLPGVRRVFRSSQFDGCPGVRPVFPEFVMGVPEFAEFVPLFFLERWLRGS